MIDTLIRIVDLGAEFNLTTNQLLTAACVAYFVGSILNSFEVRFSLDFQITLNIRRGKRNE
ncbi:Uncharacterised protein [Actinobacillus pleuropneumoniae]|jgi:hypothetical protein|nr:Uncharacterised protein [Actinobacillus pleuropneumoniae]